MLRVGIFHLARDRSLPRARPPTFSRAERLPNAERSPGSRPEGDPMAPSGAGLVAETDTQEPRDSRLPRLPLALDLLLRALVGVAGLLLGTLDRAFRLLLRG